MKFQLPFKYDTEKTRGNYFLHLLIWCLLRGLKADNQDQWIRYSLILANKEKGGRGPYPASQSAEIRGNSHIGLSTSPILISPEPQLRRLTMQEVRYVQTMPRKSG